MLKKIKRCLILGRKAMTNLDSILKGRDTTLPTKVHLVKAIVFPVVMYWCESWTIKKAEHWRIDAFEQWNWRRLLRVPWTARRSNQSILKEISPEYSLEGLMLKLKLQYFGYLIFFMVSFAVQKNLILIRSYLFIFIFMTLGGGSKMILLKFMSKSGIPKFSSKSFIVSALCFGLRSILSLFLCMVLGNVLISFVLLVAVQFSQHHSLKRLSSLHCIFLPPLSYLNWP